MAGWKSERPQDRKSDVVSAIAGVSFAVGLGVLVGASIFQVLEGVNPDWARLMGSIGAGLVAAYVGGRLAAELLDISLRFIRRFRVFLRGGR